MRDMKQISTGALQRAVRHELLMRELAPLRQRYGRAAEAIEASPIAPALVALVEHDGWTGTAAALLDLLCQIAGDAAGRAEWPPTPRRLSGELRRLAPALRRFGVHVTLPGRGPRVDGTGVMIRIACAR